MTQINPYEERRESFRSSVRPGLSWLFAIGLVADVLGMAFWGVDKEIGLAAAALVSAPLGQAMTFYFTQRNTEKSARFAQEAQDRVNDMNFQMAMGPNNHAAADAFAERRNIGFTHDFSEHDAVPTEGKR